MGAPGSKRPRERTEQYSARCGLDPPGPAPSPCRGGGSVAGAAASLRPRSGGLAARCRNALSEPLSGAPRIPRMQR